jgi:ankyrin repeat protein
MPKQTAQFHYIHAVKELQNGDAISLPSSVEFDLGPSTGMGLKPSQLAFDDEDDTGTSTDSLESRLRKAATSDDIMIMKELVEQGANINAADDHGETALHFCSDRGMLDGVVYLLELGADPNAVDHDGISVLQAAVIAGHAAVCKILLDEGADPDHQDADGDSPRSCADEDHSEKMKQLFANYPAKV